MSWQRYEPTRLYIHNGCDGYWFISWSSAMNTTCKYEVCPATTSDTELCQCTIDRIDKEQQQAISELVEALEPLSKCPVIIDPNHRHAPYIVSTKLKAKYIQKAVDLVAKYKD